MKATENTVIHLSSKERLDRMEEQLRGLTEALEALSEANKTISLQVASLQLTLQGQIKRNNTLRAELRALVDIVGEGGEISREAVMARVIDESVKELKSKVDALVKNGDLVETELVAEDSFVVGQQQDKDGNIVNQRIQFLVSSLDTETQQKILSKKAGETVDLGESQPLLYILEVYKDVSQGQSASQEE